MRTKKITALRAARQRRGWTIRELHHRAQISTGRLSMLERDLESPTDREREQLAGALEATAEELFPPR